MFRFLNQWSHRLLGKEMDAKIRQYFLGGSAKSLLLQATISVLTFLTSIIVARLAGDEGFGIYTLVFTWVSIVSVGATWGLDDLVIKQLPVYESKKQQGLMKGLLLWSNKHGILVAVVTMLLFGGLVNLTSIGGLVEYAHYYNLALISIPFFVLMHVNQASLRGLKYFGAGQLAEKLVQPLSFLLLLVGAYLFSFEVTDGAVIGFRVISLGVAAAMALALLWYYLRPLLQSAIKTDTSSTVWLGSSKYFALMSLLYVINTRVDIVFLGIYEVPPEQIAYYNVALKFSDLALIPFMVVCTVATPMFSKLFAEQKTKELQQFFSRVTQLAWALISMVLLVLVLGGKWFMSWYGDPFEAGYTALLILCVSKFIHVFVGPVSYLLMMTNLERQATYALLISVSLTIALHTIFIPRWGIDGAAYATLGGLIVFEVLLTWIAYRRAKIATTIFGNILNKNPKRPK